MGAGIDATIRVAEWVASLPGAATRIAAMSTASFLLMVGGGLWLLLWSGRPRLLGLSAIAAGMVLAPMTPRPDILVGQDGRLVAVRAEGGRFAALAPGQAGFELARWLEHDGDGRSPREAMAAPGFRCDEAGCTARLHGLTIAHPRHPSAIADDCNRADVVVLAVPRPRGCTGPRVAIDFFAVRGRGTHALYVTPDPAPLAGSPSSARAAASNTADGAGSGGADSPRAAAGGASRRTLPRAEIRIETVADARGDRPWSRLPWWAAKGQEGEASRRTATLSRGTARGEFRSRLWAFAASPEFLASQQIPSAAPEVDDALADPSLYDDRW